MGKQIRFNLGNVKSEKYSNYKKCMCYNLTKTTGDGFLYIVFLPDEQNGISIPNTNCSIKNCKNILKEYFETIKLSNT